MSNVGEQGYEEAVCDRCGHPWDVNDMRRFGSKKVCSACDAELDADDTAKFDRTERSNGQLGEVDTVDSPVEAYVDIVWHNDDARDVAQEHDIEILKEPGEPRGYQLKGSYDNVMEFLTGYLKMTPAEASLEIHDPSDPFPDEHLGEAEDRDINVCTRCGYVGDADERMRRVGSERICGSCWNKSEDEPVSGSAVQAEANEFDRFMDVIVVKEQALKKVEIADTPQRRFMKGRRERPLNRIRIGVKQ